MGTVAARRSARSRRRPVKQTFDAQQDSAGAARRLVRQTLFAWDRVKRLDDAEQVVAELVANALEGGPYTVIISHDVCTNAIHIAVHDNRPGVPVPQDPDDDSVSGRGLLIIKTLADEWGFSENIVWASFK